MAATRYHECPICGGNAYDGRHEVFHTATVHADGKRNGTYIERRRCPGPELLESELEWRRWTRKLERRGGGG